MKIETKEIYKCDHCNKLYQAKRHCAYHELVCKKNPDNKRACFGCDYLTKTNIEHLTGYGDGSGEEQTEFSMLLFCNKKRVCLHTPQSEIKQNALETIGFDNEQMPKECEFYKQELF